MNNIFIKKLNMTSFGRFQNKSISFKENFNLIYGDNESGKSTISDFIEGIFYGFDEGDKKIRFSYKKEKYKPIGSFKYSGSMILSFEGDDYRIDRNFDDGSYKIYNLEKNTEISSKKSNLNYPGEYFLKLNYSLYKNILSNYQVQKLDKDSKKVIIDFLKNPSKDLVFSKLKAISNIEKNLETIGSPRAYTKPYAKNIKLLEEKTKEVEKIKEIRKTYDLDIIKLKDQRKKISEIKKNLESLKESRDNFRKYRANSNYIEEKSRKDSLKIIEKKLEKYKSFEDINDFYFDKVDKLLEEKASFYQKNYKKNYYLPIIFSILFLFLGFLSKRYYIILLIFPLFLFFYFINKNKDINEKEKINDLNIKIKNEFSKISVSSKTSYDRAKDDYKEYEKLKVERDKTLEILNILSSQEKYEKAIDLEASNLDIVDIENKIKFYESAYDKLIEENLKLEKKLSSVEDIISSELDLIDDIKILKKKKSNLEIEIKASNMAIDIINSNKDKLSYNKNQMSILISQIIRQISKGKYKEIDYDDELEPIIVTSENEIIGIDKLSVGFFDQVNFSLRFALSNNLLDNSFMIFDDAFINYDNNRLRMALLNLLDLSRKFQIIYFTCHKREKNTFDGEGIEINFINMEQI
ncbi:ATP-binding protein [Anaerococcus rubeinfantis]|uniref:ATP-binding protein n=1 Tax=Anaerococcus rubeinfantis TaxID=1720199 RepID=UPI00073F73DF|nr:AAA family ATPase [Anaerococcus rubeinfantis]